MITKLKSIGTPEVDTSPVTAGAVKDLVAVFKLLSDETRLRIVILLSNVREMHVRALCDLLHQSQPAVSHHLALLRVAGLIECRREGKHNYYRVVRQRIPLLLDNVFAQVPAASRSIRFEDYVLAYKPAEGAGAPVEEFIAPDHATPLASFGS